MNGILTLYESRLPADFSPVSSRNRLFILQRRTGNEAVGFKI